MKDYTQFDKYLDDLNADIYAQPKDDGHTSWATAAINWWKPGGNILDVGCGSGFCSVLIKKYGAKYTGITASQEDKDKSKYKRSIHIGDMTFLPYEDNTFDGVFARHILEHSPFPIITLMEWRRVASHNLTLIVPASDYWGWGGKNHYSMANKMQIWWWLNHAGWEVLRQRDFTTKDKNFIKTFSENPQRIKEKRELIYPQGAPQTVEYWFHCVKGDIQRE